MIKQERSKGGKFVSKSDELRHVRTMRLTDSTWQKLGQIAKDKSITRADLIELWAKSDFSTGSTQLDLFDIQKEVITKDTRKTQTQLANRFGISSAALTNWHKYGNFAERSAARDPDGIVWMRDQSTRLYLPAGRG